MARVISQRGSWHRVAGAFTCTLASGMAVEASLVMKFCDSDAKAFPIERGRSLTLRDGLIPFRDPSSHSGVMSVPTGYSIPARYDFVSPFQKSGLWLKWRLKRNHRLGREVNRTTIIDIRSISVSVRRFQSVLTAFGEQLTNMGSWPSPFDIRTLDHLTEVLCWSSGMIYGALWMPAEMK